MTQAEAAAETKMDNAYVKKQTRLLREAAESADKLWAISVEKSADAAAKQKAAEAAAMALAQERKDIEVLRKKATQIAEQNTGREQDLLRREQEVCAAEKLLKSERQKVSVSQQKVVEDAQDAGAIIATAKLIATDDIEPDEIDAALARDRRADHPKHAPMLAKMRAGPKAALHVAKIFGDALSRMRRKAKIEANAELERERSQLIKGLEAVDSVVAIASRLIKTFVPQNQQDQERGKLKETWKGVARASVHMERSRNKAPDRDDTR
jgi:mannose/fructose/N-acetylgalactosamine-specific phosphotransferase system component IIB